MHVLLADDEPDIVRIYSEMLRGNRFSVTEATDGKEVLTLLHEETFDLLILDLFMPRMDGFEALKRLRGRGDAVPVIIITGHFPDEEVRERVEGLSVQPVPQKPVMISTLLHAVNHLCPDPS